MKHLTLITILSFFITPAFGADTTHVKTILLIESYHSEYDWDRNYKIGLKEIIKDSAVIKTFEMDTKRLPKSTYPERARLALKEYDDIDPDLVILADDNALKYVGPGLANRTTPVVYLGINNNPRRYKMAGHKNITGVLERPLLKSSIYTIKRLLPRTKKFLILFDDGATSQASFSELFGNKPSIISSSGIQVDMKLIGKLSDWKHAVSTAKENGYDALILGLYHTITDNQSVHVKAPDILAWTSKNAPVPPFGFWKFSVGSGKAIGGFVMSGREQGIAAAKIIQEIFSGKTPDKIYPVTGKKGELYFSFSELKRWKLALPTDMIPDVGYTE